jgi:hypothetical protein
VLPPPDGLRVRPCALTVIGSSQVDRIILSRLSCRATRSTLIEVIHDPDHLAVRNCTESKENEATHDCTCSGVPLARDGKRAGWAQSVICECRFPRYKFIFLLPPSSATLWGNMTVVHCTAPPPPTRYEGNKHHRR